MPIARMLLFASFLASSARADWLPQWSVPQPTEFEPMRPLEVELAPDGSAFVGATFTRANQPHMAVLRIEADGRLAWTQDIIAISSPGGIERLSSGRIAAFGVPRSEASAALAVHGDASGEALWAHDSSLGRVQTGRIGLRALVESSGGDLLLALSDPTSGDYVVARYAADGSERPPWRRHAGAQVRATDIAALAGGGAVVTGVGTGLDGGYTTIRFDASGAVVFEDLEPGDHGSPLGPAYVAPDAHGDLLLAGTPEDGVMGVPEATVWKLAADGARIWKRVLGVSEETPLGRDLYRFRLAANGDALLVTDGGGSATERLHLVRLDGVDGQVVWDRLFSFSIGYGQFPPYVLAETSNGRILLAGYVKTEQSSYARLLEFGADGELCRRRDDPALYYIGAAVGSAQGWIALGAGPDGLLAQRYDADGPCEERPDRIFVDGFDDSAPLR